METGGTAEKTAESQEKGGKGRLAFEDKRVGRRRSHQLA